MDSGALLWLQGTTELAPINGFTEKSSRRLALHGSGGLLLLCQGEGSTARQNILEGITCNRGAGASRCSVQGGNSLFAALVRHGSQ